MASVPSTHATPNNVPVTKHAKMACASKPLVTPSYNNPASKAEYASSTSVQPAPATASHATVANNARKDNAPAIGHVMSMYNVPPMSFVSTANASNRVATYRAPARHHKHASTPRAVMTNAPTNHAAMARPAAPPMAYVSPLAHAATPAKSAKMVAVSKTHAKVSHARATNHAITEPAKKMPARPIHLSADLVGCASKMHV